MAREIKRHLKVGNAPEYDEGKLLVRMHGEDLPKGLKWNRYIHLSTGGAKVTCRVRTNQMAEVPHPRIHQININKRLRESLGVKAGSLQDFYVSKALRWVGPFYVIRYHPDRNSRRKALILSIAAIIVALAAIGGGVSCLLS